MTRTSGREKTLISPGPATAGDAGRRRRASLVVLAFAALALLAGCGTGSGQEEGGSGSPQGGSGGSEEKAARLGTPVLGSADAPVVLTEYSDYQ